MIYIIIFIFIILFVYLRTKQENFNVKFNYYHWERKHGGWKDLNINSKYQNKFAARIENKYIDYLDDKDNLCTLLKNKEYSPKCYILNKDKNNNSKIFNKIKNNNELWFLKKNNMGRGNGVYALKGYNIEKQYNLIKNTHVKFIIQKGINNPLLYNKKKIDARFFYLILLNKDKLSFYLFNNAFFKTSNNNFDKNNMSSDVQLTNDSKNKGNNSKQLLMSEYSNYKLMLDNSIKLFTDLSKEINKNFDKDYKTNNEFEYQLAGPDVVFTDSYKPYLIELNSKTPSYITSKNSAKIKDMKLKIKKGIKNMIMNIFNNKSINIEKYGFIKLL